MAPPSSRNAGFTLVEVLVVVVILGILAGIVIPQFTSASEASRENSVKMSLFRTRQQIEVYRSQHHGNLPTANFVDEMTMSSNAQGETAAPGSAGYRLGPYIRDVPINPFTDGNAVGQEKLGDSDWHYDPADGTFHANDSDEHWDY